MSDRATRRLLLLGLVLLVPLPLVAGVATGRVPVVRMGLLAGACLGVIASEGARGAVGLLAAMLVAQAALWTAGLWVLAWLAGSGLARLPARGRLAATLAVLALGVALASATQPYRTPFRADGVRASWLEILE